MNKISYNLLCIWLFFVGIIISCDKKYDLIEQTQFQEPLISDGAENVRLKNVQIGFQNIRDYKIVLNIYFDTINPPIDQIIPIKPYIPILIPGKNYFWFYKVNNYGVENTSNVLSFTTVSFIGDWKLDSLFYSDSDPIIIADNPNLDDFLVSNYDLLEFKINDDNSLIKTFGQESLNYQNTKFMYEPTLDSIHFINPINQYKYSFQLINAGKYKDNIILYIKNSRNVTLYYSKFNEI